MVGKGQWHTDPGTLLRHALAGNEKARERFEQNRFTVTRQLRYSRDQTRRALDIVLFINGLPVVTFELKNNLTEQTVDEAEVRFCTHLKGKASWFLPFNRGWNDGAGNPPDPSGIRTRYLWREVLARESLADILENYAQLVETRDDKTGRKRRRRSCAASSRATNTRSA